MCRTIPCLQHSQDMLSEELTLSVCRRTWWCVGENFCASLCLLTSCELVVFSFLNMYICTVIDYSFFFISLSCLQNHSMAYHHMGKPSCNFSLTVSHSTNIQICNSAIVGNVCAAIYLVARNTQHRWGVGS